MIEKVVITDALLQAQGEIRLHPALLPWQDRLLGMKQQWQVEHTCFTPMSWFSAHLDSRQHIPAAALLADMLPDLPENTKQYWLVSAYHARLTRSTLRVMPDSMVDFSAKEAVDLCVVLNPLLQDAGVSLHHTHGAMVLACDRVWDVLPCSFAQISGQSLPDRPPQGADAGAWMRLQTEIQMMLHQQPIHTASGIAIHGIWCWQAAEKAVALADFHMEAVATRHLPLHVLLQAADKAREATCIISEADDLPLLLQADMPLPPVWHLLGEGQSVRLSPSWWRRGLGKIKQATWKGVSA